MSIKINNSKYILSGRIVNNAGTRLSEFKVCVFDKDFLLDDFLGKSISDSEGNWSISFDRKDFSTKILGFSTDKHPDLYFKVYDDNMLLLDTSGAPLNNAKEQTEAIVLNILSESETIPQPQSSNDPFVIMADGTTKQLSALKKGDKIRNGNAKASTLSLAKKSASSSMLLYSVNNDAPFLLEEEAVMTQRGWCSLNPKLAKEINPDLSVHQLQVGDVIWRSQDASDIQLEVVHSINKLARNNKQIVALHVRTGDPSMWLNGCCVLINYPEININHTASNIYGKMSAKEEMEFRDKLKKMRPELEKSFGKSAVETALQMLKDPKKAASNGPSTDRYGNPKYPNSDLNDFSLPAMILVPESGELPENFKNLAIIRGHLVIDGKIINSYCKGDHLYWNRSINGIEEYGTIQFAPARHHGTGVLEFNGQVIQFSVFSEIDYTTNLTTDNKQWYEFAIEFKPNKQGHRVAVGILKDKDGKALSDLEVTTAISTTTNKKKEEFLTANIEWSPTWVAFNGGKWIAAVIQWSTNYKTFSGTVYEYDDSKPLNRGKAIPVSGTAKNWDDVMSYSAKLTEHLTKANNQASFRELAAGLLPDNSAIQKSLSLTDSTPLTVEALFSLAPPDMTQVHENSFATIKNMMLYTIPNQELNWFNETRPAVGKGEALSQKEADTAKNNTVVNSFLNDKFALGYLTQAFSQSNDPKIKALLNNKTTKDKLGYFWQGNGDKCFPRLKGYNLAAATVMDETYTKMVPGLDQYLNDTSKDWGKELYLYCLDKPTLNGLAMQNMLGGGKQKINSLAMKLHALSPEANVKVGKKSVSYATSIYEAIVNVRLQNVSKNFTSGKKEDMVEYLTAFLKEYFTNLIDGTGPWGDNIRAAAKKDLQQYMTDNQIKNIEGMMAHLGGAIAGFASLMISAKTKPLTLRLAKFAEKFPKISKALGGFFSMAAFGLCTISLYQAILNWKNLTAVQKAQVIINTAYSVVSVFNKFASYKAAKTLTNAASTEEEKISSAIKLENTYGTQDYVPSGDSIAVSIDAPGASTDSPFLNEAGRATGAVINSTEGTDEVVSAWTRIAKVSGGFAEGLGLLAMAGACVATGFQIANDFKTGQPWDIKMLDILEEIANGVCFLVAAGISIAGLLSIEVASFIPVIGVVVAVIGIIIAIVLLFVHRTPPPTPEETFVKNKCIPFLNGLDSPPAKWLAARAKAQSHLNKTPAVS